MPIKIDMIVLVSNASEFVRLPSRNSAQWMQLGEHAICRWQVQAMVVTQKVTGQSGQMQADD
jgi:hypothetical protein